MSRVGPPEAAVLSATAVPRCSIRPPRRVRRIVRIEQRSYDHGCSALAPGENLRNKSDRTETLLAARAHSSRWLRQEGSKILGSSWSPNRSRAMRNPPYIEGMKPTPLQPRLYINTGLRGSYPMSRTRDSL